MGNYKPIALESITVGGVTRGIPGHGKIKVLISTAKSTTGDSFHEIHTDVVYTPLTGKRFVLYGIILYSGATARSFKLYESVSVDSTTQAINIMLFQDAGNQMIQEYADHIQHDIESGNFLTAKVGNTSGAYFLCIAVGAEINYVV